MLSERSVKRCTTADHAVRRGAIPARSLHFLCGQMEDARGLVKRYHYSHRVPSSIQFVGSLHRDGGLFGDQGEMVAAAFFSSPPTRWSENVLELSRLVRVDGLRVPLTFLISRCCSELKRKGNDLLVSFADNTQGHQGYVYRASNWNFHGKREPSMDGLIVNGAFIPGRTCNARFGTRSPSKLMGMYPNFEIEPHYDEGKFLYWKALGNRGIQKAKRLGLTTQANAMTGKPHP
jgi:hypothetical protein